MSRDLRVILAAAAIAGLLLGVLLALAVPVAPAPAAAAREDLAPGEISALLEEARLIAKEAADGPG